MSTYYSVLTNRKFLVSLRSSFILLVFSPFSVMMFVFQYSSQSLLFNEIMDPLLGRFLNLLLKSFFVCISESRNVSCWGCNANSTPDYNVTKTQNRRCWLTCAKLKS